MMNQVYVYLDALVHLMTLIVGIKISLKFDIYSVNGSNHLFITKNGFRIMGYTL